MEEWAASVDSATSPAKAQSVPSTERPAQLSPQALRDQAAALHLRFLEALQRDLRGSVARVRLYLEDERTVKILLEHVSERVASLYERWSDMSALLAQSAPMGTAVEILSTARLKETLRDVCGM